MNEITRSPSLPPTVIPRDRRDLRISQMPPLPDPFGFAGAFAGTHRNHLLAGGGANFPDGVMPWDGGKKVWSDRLFSLDLSTPGAAWKSAGGLPERNGYGVSLTVDEGVLIIGGSDEDRHLCDVWLMKLGQTGAAEFWEFPSLPGPLAQMCGAAVGRKIHLCGGIDRADAVMASNCHWVLNLDGLAAGWCEAPPLPADGRILATGAAVGSDFIIAGGCSLAPDTGGKTARTYLSDAWKFSEDTWIPLADLPRPAVAAASPAPVRNGALFIVSGDDGQQLGLASPRDHRGFCNEILRYDLAENRWSSVGRLAFPAPVTLPTAAWGDDTILVSGELRPGLRTPQVFRFSPAS